VIIRKNLSIEEHGARLFDDYRYFFYLTNDRQSSAAEIVFSAEEQRRVLRMEFRTFVEAFIRIPCQVLRTGRQLVCRLLGWNRWQDVFFRAVDALSKPLTSRPARVRAMPLLR
jgi:hypothetical protein